MPIDPSIPITIGLKALGVGYAGETTSSNGLQKVSPKVPITGNQKLLALAKTQVGFEGEATNLKKQERLKPENNGKPCSELQQKAEEQIMKQKVQPQQQRLEQNEFQKQTNIQTPKPNPFEKARQEFADQKHEINRARGRLFALADAPKNSNPDQQNQTKMAA